MEKARQLEEAVAALERAGIEVQEASLGGEGGGLCSVRGKRIVVVDLDADVTTRLNRCLMALGSLPESESAYLLPALREAMEQPGRAGSGSESAREAESDRRA